MSPLFVSLGSDCAVAEYLRDAGLRDAAYPLDWCVSYGGASGLAIMAVEDGGERAAAAACAVDVRNWNARYGVYHMHAAFPSALPTMARRFERLRATILADDPTPVVFIRRSHPLHHHLERGAAALADEVADAREFARFLEGANPAKSSRGGLRVELLLACDLCHPKVDPAEAAAGLSNLRVHNLTRCASASFADGHPTKTYADAMAAAHVAMGCAPVATAAPKNSAGDHPFALEEA